jgi:hypothetical protein
VAHYRLDSLGIKSQWDRDFQHLSTLTLEHTHPRVQWEPRLFPRGSGQGMALTTHHHLVLRLKNEYRSILLYLWAFMACSRVNCTFSLYLCMAWALPSGSICTTQTTVDAKGLPVHWNKLHHSQASEDSGHADNNPWFSAF